MVFAALHRHGPSGQRGKNSIILAVGGGEASISAVFLNQEKAPLNYDQSSVVQESKNAVSVPS